MTQCVTIRECLIEQPHVAEIGCIKAFAELSGELGGNLREHCLAIRGTGLASLLELDNVPTNDPASAHLDDIHGGDGLPTSFQYDGTQVCQEAAGILLRHLR